MTKAPSAGFAHQLVHPADDLRYPLIEAGDPPPYLTYNENGKASVLLVADHASPCFPAAMNQLGLDDWVLDRHVTWDLGSDQLTRYLADLLDAPAILAGYSRLIIDPNRQLDDPTAFVEVSDGIVIPGNQGISDEHKALRVESFFRPYHNAITKRLQAFEAAGIVPAFISMHTCTPVFNSVERPWHIGVMWDKDERISGPMMARLEEFKDVCFGNNQPYSGRHTHDFTIDHHAEDAGLPHVGIEVRQDLVLDADGAHHWAGILASALEDTLADPNLYRRLSA